MKVARISEYSKIIHLLSYSQFTDEHERPDQHLPILVQVYTDIFKRAYITVQ